MKLESLNKANNSPVCHTGINKSNTFNPKNKVYQAYKARIKSVNEQRAEEMYKDRTFGDEYEAVKTVTDVLKIVFSFASACTVLVALNWALKPLLGQYLSILIGFFACVSLESLKAFVWSKLSKNILKYLKYPLPLVVAAIGFNILSVGGSIFGAYQLPMETKELEIDKIELKDLDKIAKKYDTDINKISDLIQQQTEEISKTTSNSTKRSISANIALQTQEKQTLLKHKEEALKTAQNSNEKKLLEAQSKAQKFNQERSKKVSQDKTNCMIVAGLFELGLIICLAFGSYYLFRVEIDRTDGFKDQGSQDQTDTNKPQQTTTTSIQIGQQRQANYTAQNDYRQIGFKQSKSSSKDTLHNVSDTQKDTLHNVSTGVPNGVCQNPKCGKEFTRKSVLKKYCSDKCRRQTSYDKLNKKSNN